MKRFGIAMLLAGLLACFAVVPTQVRAADDSQAGVWGACGGTNDSPICSDKTQAPTVVKRIVDVLLYAIGALSVIMILWSGMKYITSAGNPETVKSAKNTLLYSVIGLVVATLAIAIVNFVVDEFDKPTTFTGCMKIDDLAKRKQCQTDMIKSGAPDAPTSSNQNGVINQ